MEPPAKKQAVGSGYVGRFPKDLWKIILGHLPLWALLTCRLVSRWFKKETVVHVKKRWASLTREMSDAFPFITELGIGACRDLKSCISALGPRISRIEELHIPSGTGFLDAFPSLTRLSLGEVHWKSVTELRKVAPRLKKLEVLFFSEELLQLLPLCRGLEKFWLLADETGVDEVIQAVTEYCPKVRSVGVMDGFGVDNETWERLFSRCTNLEDVFGLALDNPVFLKNTHRIKRAETICSLAELCSAFRHGLRISKVDLNEVSALNEEEKAVLRKSEVRSVSLHYSRANAEILAEVFCLRSLKLMTFDGRFPELTGFVSLTKLVIWFSEKDDAGTILLSLGIHLVRLQKMKISGLQLDSKDLLVRVTRDEELFLRLRELWIGFPEMINGPFRPDLSVRIKIERK